MGSQHLGHSNAGGVLSKVHNAATIGAKVVPTAKTVYDIGKGVAHVARVAAPYIARGAAMLA